MKETEETGGLSSFLDEFHKKLFRANTDSHSSPPLCVRVLVRVHVCVRVCVDRRIDRLTVRASKRD